MEMIRIILAEIELSKSLWMEIASTVAYLKNLSPTSTLNGRTPHEAWSGKIPDLSHVRILGSIAYVHIPKENRKKLDYKAKVCQLVGYGGTNQYRLWDPSRKDVIVSRDVVFDERYKVQAPTTIPVVQIDERQAPEPATPESATTESATPEPVTTPTRERSVESTIVVQPLSTRPQSPSPQSDESDTEEATINTIPVAKTSGRSNKGARLERFDEIDWDKRKSTAKIAITASDDEPEPTSFEEAVGHPTRGKQWEQSIQEEYDAHIKNGTWELVPLPNDRQTISCKWVFHHKRDQNGKIARFKSRLVARGFTQVYGIDYLETYSPVAKLASIRILLAIATVEDLEIHQMDAVTAFLAENIDEEIYMDQPEGFSIVNKDGKKLVCRIRKGLYGLKQSARLWNQKIRRILESYGFVSTHADHCIYVNKETGVIIAIWVDDLIIFSKGMDGIEKIKAQLNNKLEMKNLGEMHFFLDIQVHRDK